MARTKAQWGTIERLPSGRYRAKFPAPDGTRRSAPMTFDTKLDAGAWLAETRTLIASDPDWQPRPPKAKALTLAEYGDLWLARRKIKPRTRNHYRDLLDRLILPTFARMPLPSVTAEMVVTWHAGLDPDNPTQNSHAYGLLRTILGTATEDGVIDRNPCHIRGAGNTRRKHIVTLPTMDQFDALVEAMPERHRLMVLLGMWCEFRYGELTELRRSDIDLTERVIRLRRGVTRADGGYVVGDPKSQAGIRDVYIPASLVPAIREHLAAMPMTGKDGLLFPGADGVSHLAPSAFYGKAPTETRKGFGWYYARTGAGLPSLRFHDLRHAGASVASAMPGIAPQDHLERIGQGSLGVLGRYLHTSQDRQRQIATYLDQQITEHQADVAARGTGQPPARQ